MSDTTASEDEDFRDLLERVKDERGFDFTAYKPASLRRRIDKRIAATGLGGYAAYSDHLDANPGEFPRLFDTILINVTGLFRDPEAWLFLRDAVVPRILEARAPAEPIRIWSVGCSTGQEAYSLAMLFAEALGRADYRARVKIYGTDVDEAALTVARQATYPASDIPDLPGPLAALLEAYTEDGPAGRVIDRDVRRAVIFGRHDILTDAPISRVDLIACRNTLMYFNTEAQRTIVERFHFALREGGILFLGKAETLLSSSSRFDAVDLRHHVFSRDDSDSRPATARSEPVAPAEDGGGGLPSLRDVMFAGAPICQIGLDAAGRVVLANARARAMFRLGDGDMGRPFRDLTLSYRPLELRSLIDQATQEGRVVTAQAEWTEPGGNETRFLDFQIQPLRDRRGHLLGTSICATDATEHRRLEEELQESNREVETAYEELQAANEELETTNEELQSTVEELETTNEELQSTNEELETMNEEMQSTNEELHAVNTALGDRTRELDEVNAHLEAILASLAAGVAVVDDEAAIRVWNDAAQGLWGLTAGELRGTSFMELDSGLPLEPLRPSLSDVLEGRSDGERVVIDAHDRRGRGFRCQVSISPLRQPVGPPAGAVIVMEPLPQAT